MVHVCMVFTYIYSHSGLSIKGSMRDNPIGWGDSRDRECTTVMTSVGLYGVFFDRNWTVLPNLSRLDWGHSGHQIKIPNENLTTIF